ncbi:MAG: DUF6279 family lipoprotein [Marinomonas sp.]
MRKSLITLLVLTLTGCSFGRYFYNNIHHVVLWRASDYVSLERSQKNLVIQASKDFTVWHRANELEKYRTLLAELHHDLETDTLTTEGVKAYQLRTKQLTQNVVDYIKPILPDLFTTLTTKQYEQIINNLTKRLERRQKRTLDDRVEDGIKDMEEWFGELTPEQILMVTELETQRFIRNTQRHQARQDWISELANDITDNVNRPISFNQTLWSLLEKSLSSNQSNDNIGAAIWFIRHESQKETVLKKLEDMQEMIDSLLEV